MLASIENKSPQPEQGKTLRGFHPHRVRISTAVKADFTHALHGFHPPQVDLFGFYNVARIVLDAGNISLMSVANQYHSAVRQNITRLSRISLRRIADALLLPRQSNSLPSPESTTRRILYS